MKRITPFLLILLVLTGTSCEVDKPNSEDVTVLGFEGAWIMTGSLRVEQVGNNDPVSYRSDYTGHSILDREFLSSARLQYETFRYDADYYGNRGFRTEMSALAVDCFVLPERNLYSYSVIDNELRIMEQRSYQNNDGQTVTIEETDFYESYTGELPPDEWSSTSNYDLGYSQARILSANVPADSTLTAGNSDWFCFTANSGVTYTLTTDGGSADTDTVMVLYDSTGTNYLDRNDDYMNGSLSSQIEFRCESGGVYYIKVRGFSDNVTGAYTLTITTQ